MIAVQSGNFEICNYLLKNEAKCNLQNVEQNHYFNKFKNYK